MEIWSTLENKLAKCWLRTGRLQEGIIVVSSLELFKASVLRAKPCGYARLLTMHQLHLTSPAKIFPRLPNKEKEWLLKCASTLETSQASPLCPPVSVRSLATGGNRVGGLQQKTTPEFKFWPLKGEVISTAFPPPHSEPTRPFSFLL